ncbi:MAG: NUDIX domain-containing protein [Marinomonas sp.]
MKFCSECGSANLVLRKTNHDTHSRYTCADCEKIFYHNPKVIAGCIVEHEGKYLMCQRAIKPRTGTWTLPAGFMECGETVEQAAQREVWEETGAKIEIIAPYSIFSVPQINEVYIMFRAKLVAFTDEPGPETLAADLLSADQIPWDNIFYPAIKDILQRYIAEKEQGTFGMYTGCSDEGIVHFMQ